MRTDAQIERDCVEYVFGLTGGELADKWLSYQTVDGSPDGCFRYHYDGVPDHAASDYPDRFGADADYFTAVYPCLYGSPPIEIVIAGKLYTRVARFQSSGETECPGLHEDGNGHVRADHCNGGERCMYCDESIGVAHGLIYLGDGWCELVYRHDKIQHMRTVASQHNTRVWSEAEVACTCTDPDCADGILLPASYADGANAVECSSCGKPMLAEATAQRRQSWWWETCAPGCLPDSDVMGPFDSETDALEDATEGLLDD